jgi:pullulanase
MIFMFNQNINNKPARLFYPGDDLGLTFSESEITYKIWSPPAQSAVIEIYADDRGIKKVDQFALQPAPSDTWEVKLPQKYYGNYYRLNLRLPRQEFNFVDPWTKAVGTNSNYGLIVDPSRVYPPTWTKELDIAGNIQLLASVIV